MPPRPAPRRTPPPRRQIIWLRAIPVFVGMMAALLLSTLYLPLWFPGNPIVGNGNSIWLSLIFGLIGAFLISRFATVAPPPPPSKAQARKMAATAARTKPKRVEETEEDEAVAVGPRPTARPRNRRRRR